MLNIPAVDLFLSLLNTRRVAYLSLFLGECSTDWGSDSTAMSICRIETSKGVNDMIGDKNIERQCPYQTGAFFLPVEYNKGVKITGPNDTSGSSSSVPRRVFIELISANFDEAVMVLGF